MQVMEAIPLIIVGIMGLVFCGAVILIIVGNIYDRRATRKQRKVHQSYFRQ
jgi:uncharacterized integral membrane protein